MNIHNFFTDRFLSSLLGLILGVTLGYGLVVPVAGAQQPIMMRHSWEFIPDLGVEWIDKIEGKMSPDEALYHSQLLASNDNGDIIQAAQWYSAVADLLDDQAKQTAFQQLLDLLTREKINRQIRQSIAAATMSCFVGTDDHAKKLWDSTKEDPTIRPSVEQWLIDRKKMLAVDLWRSRLVDRRTTELELGLALDGLAALGIKDSAGDIAKLIVSESLAPPLVLQACRALGVLTEANQVELARKLWKSRYPTHDLLAALVIVNHTDDQAKQLMNELLKSNFQPAKRLAFQWYISHLPSEVQALAPGFRNEPDSGLRRMAIDQLIAIDTIESLAALGEYLSDDNANNRMAARDGLARSEKGTAFPSQLAEIINGALALDFGPGSEQAIELAVKIKARQFVPNLVQLLDHSMLEVRVRAAWGIVALELERAEDIEAIHQRCLAFTERVKGEDAKIGIDETTLLAYLFESLGKAKHEPALPMLHKYIPKNEMPHVPRASAIWSIGRILEGSQDAQLAKELAARMLDNGPEGELLPVRFTSALALGYLRNPDSVQALGRTGEQPPSAIGLATQWSRAQIEK